MNIEKMKSGLRVFIGWKLIGIVSSGAVFMDIEMDLEVP
jgi:hypothetical protein